MDGILGILVMAALLTVVSAAVRSAQKKGAQSPQNRSENPSFDAQTKGQNPPYYGEGVPPHSLQAQLAQTQTTLAPSVSVQPVATLPAKPAQFARMRPSQVLQFQSPAHGELCAVEHKGLQETETKGALTINTDTNAIVQGMIWSEIWNKPKALRRRNP